MKVKVRPDEVPTEYNAGNQNENTRSSLDTLFTIHIHKVIQDELKANNDASDVNFTN